MNILILLLLLAIVVFFSWLFSGFELGLISQDRLKLEQEAKKNNLKKRILDLYDNNDKAFGTLLIGNSISTVTAAAIATYIFVNYLFDGLSYAEILSNFIITFLILFFCEILPKNLFRDFPNLVELFFPLINAFYIVLKPLVKVVTFINRILKKLFKIDENQSFSAFTKDDLSFILEETFNEGNIQQPQKEMLEDALEFNELIAKNVMKPRLEIVAIKDDMTIDQIIKVTKEEGYTRYPVYGEDLDDITGVLIIYDILKNDNSNQTAKELQRDALFVPETIDVSVLLKEMQMNKKSIAIVKDAYGGTAGLVTIEDILEEIVGEIDDEYDIDEVKDIEKIDDHTWIVNGFVEVDTLIDDYDLDLPEGDYETIAGMIIAQLERIPRKGQKIVINKYKIEILEVTNIKIKKVKIVENIQKEASEMRHTKKDKNI